MSTRITTPAHAGSRDQAQSLLGALPLDLEGETVVIDCRQLVISTPSFFDEMVKEAVVERGATMLDLVDADDRAQRHVTRSAANRHVSDRVRVAPRI